MAMLIPEARRVTAQTAIGLSKGNSFFGTGRSNICKRNIVNIRKQKHSRKATDNMKLEKQKGQFKVTQLASNALEENLPLLPPVYDLDALASPRFRLNMPELSAYKSRDSRVTSHNKPMEKRKRLKTQSSIAIHSHIKQLHSSCININRLDQGRDIK